jgi:hypothetical protein
MLSLGGGRSSYEIFSVGSPIVVLKPRTSILQLTSGMYLVMGILQKVNCVTYTNEVLNYFDFLYIFLSKQKQQKKFQFI